MPPGAPLPGGVRAPSGTFSVAKAERSCPVEVSLQLPEDAAPEYREPVRIIASVCPYRDVSSGVSIVDPADGAALGVSFRSSCRAADLTRDGEQRRAREARK